MNGRDQWGFRVDKMPQTSKATLGWPGMVGEAISAGSGNRRILERTAVVLGISPKAASLVSADTVEKVRHARIQSRLANFSDFAATLSH